jgi:hypothetical protein
LLFFAPLKALPAVPFVVKALLPVAVPDEVVVKAEPVAVEVIPETALEVKVVKPVPLLKS